MKSVIYKNKGFIGISLIGLIIAVAVIMFIFPNLLSWESSLESDYSPRYYELLNQDTYTHEEREEFKLERCNGEYNMLMEIKKSSPAHYQEMKNKYDEICS